MSPASIKRDHLAAFTHEDEGRPVQPTLWQAADTVIKGKERAREAADTWTNPISVHDGIFQGKVVRFLLRCVQEPVSGKRKTDKDRRPLAPVPILRLWVRECHQNAAGMWSEVNMDLGPLDPSCLVCEVEISPDLDGAAEGLSEHMRTQGPIEGQSEHLYDPSFHPGSPESPGSGRPPIRSSKSNPGTPARDRILPRHIIAADITAPDFPLIQHRASWTADQHWGTRSSIASASTMPFDAPQQQDYRGSDAFERVAGRSRKVQRTGMKGDELEEGELPGHIKERNLFGTLHVPAVKVVAPSEELGLWFLFTDLCVNLEGIYALRFRVFDLSVIKPGMPPVPPFADCESQSFKVYSPRAFPGLPKPTELSEHFTRQGFKLNTRKNEKVARTPSPDSTMTTPSGSVSRSDPTRTMSGSAGPSTMWPDR